MDTKPKSLILAFATLTAFIAACSTQHEMQTDTRDAARVSPVAVAPLEYFEQHCARCHGPNGSHYGDSFGVGLSEHELVEVVDEMAYGPAFAPIEGVELDAQVAFHRSMIRNTPFLIWNRQDGSQLRGEVLPGSTVTVQSSLGSLKAEVMDHLWRVTLPEAWTDEPVVLVAANSLGTTELDLSRAAFSHQEPIQDH